MTPVPISAPPNGQRTIIRVGCRASSVLAQIQAQLVLDRLAIHFPSHIFELSSNAIFPPADRDKILPFRSLSQVSGSGGVSLWTSGLEEALLAGDIDILVHSLKDVPTMVKNGCEVTPVLRREDPRDCLVVKKGMGYQSLEELPPGAVIGTGSVRRVAQLKRRYPSLVFQDVRGNIDTRLAKLDSPSSPYTALILASAAFIRLSLTDRISAFLSSPTLYPAVGQGSLGAEFRSSDLTIKRMISSLEDWVTGWPVRAERALLGVLEGGCAVPVGIWSTRDDLSSSGAHSMNLTLFVVITSPDGSKEVNVEASEVITSAEEALVFGQQTALSLLDKGGRQIMEKLTADISQAYGH